MSGVLAFVSAWFQETDKFVEWSFTNLVHFVPPVYLEELPRFTVFFQNER